RRPNEGSGLIPVAENRGKRAPPDKKKPRRDARPSRGVIGLRLAVEGELLSVGEARALVRAVLFLEPGDHVARGRQKLDAGAGLLPASDGVQTAGALGGGGHRTGLLASGIRGKGEGAGVSCPDAKLPNAGHRFLRARQRDRRKGQDSTNSE